MPDVFLNKPFMEGFTKVNPKPVDIIQEWWDEDRFSLPRLVEYIIQYFKVPYQLLVEIIYKILRGRNNVHFNMEWVLIAHNVEEVGKILFQLGT
jgi:hypothetical protein